MNTSRLCDRVAIIDVGELVAEGTPADLKAGIGTPGPTLDDVFLHYTGTRPRPEAPEAGATSGVFATAHGRRRLRAGWPGWLLFGVLAVAFGVVWASVSNLIALRTRNSEVTMVAGFFVTLPVLFLSPAFFPSPLLPGWLQAVTTVNPASQVIETGQRLVSGGGMLTQDLRTLLALGITAAVFMPLTVTAFRAR